MNLEQRMRQAMDEAAREILAVCSKPEYQEAIAARVARENYIEDSSYVQGNPLYGREDYV